MSWREFRTVKDLCFDGRTLQAEVWLDLEMGVYGADADGRRGEKTNFVNSWGYEGIWDLDTGEDLTLEFKSNPIFNSTVLRKI